MDVPLLRKDFVVDPYMLAEAVDAGADAVLLLAGAVEPARLLELWDAAKSLGLDVLLEVVQPYELGAPDTLGATLVGVNARDLETLAVDEARFERLAPERRRFRPAPFAWPRAASGRPRTSAGLPGREPVRRWSGKA